MLRLFPCHPVSLGVASPLGAVVVDERELRQVNGEGGGGGKRQARVLKGFRDYLPEQMILRQRIIAIFRDIFERHGFEPLDTPALEYLDVLTGKAGENEKLMYRFEDAGGREVGLRYDLTVPLARVVAMHQNDLVLPFKRYHIAPVWRAENPQRGRFREFWQCDADIAGSASPLADAEVIAIMAEALEAIGLPGLHDSHQPPQTAGKPGSCRRRSGRAGDRPLPCRSTSSTRSGATESRAS